MNCINLDTTVSCPDLPGHGTSAFPLSEVTYDIYYQKLDEEVKKYDKAILVAHLAQNGQSLLDIAITGGP